MGNNCCSNKDADKFEAQEANRKDGLSGSDLAVAEMVANSAGSPPAAAKVGEPGRAPAAAPSGEPGKGTEFPVKIDKTSGMRLGVDVDHQDGVTLLIDAITGGLAERWNGENPERALRQGDRIVEVNGIRGDVLQLVEECKKNKVLELKVLRS